MKSILPTYSEIYDSSPKMFYTGSKKNNPNDAFNHEVQREMKESTGFGSLPAVSGEHGNTWCFEGAQTFYLLKNGVKLSNMNEGLYENPQVNLFRKTDIK